jgi:predicted adenylyl cyclase CyaB
MGGLKVAENIEIKARLHDVARTHRVASALSDRPAECFWQRDVFFHTQRGRLKLRWQEDDQAYLVYYERPDQASPRSSAYCVAETRDAASLERALAAALGVRGEVRKHRTLYIVGSTRIHIDQVQGLGHFLELEAMLDGQQTSAEGYATVASLMEQLGVSDDDLIAGAYIDLLERGGSGKAEHGSASD